MADAGSMSLVVGAALSAAAAVAHLACIVVGAPAYRFMGAGERMAQAAAAGRRRPTLVTLAIAGMLFLWSAYALSAAGLGPALPFTRLALLAISGVYLARALAFPLLRRALPGNSTTFWWVSSAICGVIGLVHAHGTLLLWRGA